MSGVGNTKLLELPGEPTLDEVLRRWPPRIGDAEADAVIAALRQERAAWVVAEAKRAERKRRKRSGEQPTAAAKPAAKAAAKPVDNGEPTE